MNHSHHSNQQLGADRKATGFRPWLIAAAVVAGGFIVLNVLIPHKSHVLDALPYLLIGAVLFMHLGGHGGHDHGSKKH